MLARAYHSEKEAGTRGQLVSLLGINFVVGGYPEARARLADGGLMVCPSAPVLSLMESDAEHGAALRSSDIAIPDSGLMVLLARLLCHQRMTRLSGLTFMRHFLEESELSTAGQLFLVDPSDDARERNHAYLRSRGISIASADHYVAPLYSQANVEDEALLEQIESRRPRYVVVNLGGGTQEKLGFYLKRSLNYRPAILCTGAAIAFLTGEQVHISPRMDRWRLGWLLRCLDDPGRSIPKYRQGLLLAALMVRRARGSTPADPFA